MRGTRLKTKVFACFGCDHHDSVFLHYLRDALYDLFSCLFCIKNTWQIRWRNALRMRRKRLKTRVFACFGREHHDSVFYTTYEARYTIFATSKTRGKNDDVMHYACGENVSKQGFCMFWLWTPWLRFFSTRGSANLGVILNIGAILVGLGSRLNTQDLSVIFSTEIWDFYDISGLFFRGTSAFSSCVKRAYLHSILTDIENTT